jgi:hypothetical protein
MLARETSGKDGTSETRQESNRSSRAFLACLALHTPPFLALADFFSILPKHTSFCPFLP